MIQKLTLLILICITTSSCGKKADPVYKESNLNNDTKIISVV